MFWDEDVTLTGMINYKNVQVRFVCTELKHFWYTEALIAYYISIRNRSFDSVSQVAPLIDKFREVGADLNQIRFLKNDLTCKN